MSGLAIGAAELAVVIGVALLAARRNTVTSVLLALQSLAVAAAAFALQQPLTGAATLLVNLLGIQAFLRLGRRREATCPAPPKDPGGGTVPALLAGAVLVVLAQAGGEVASALSVVLLALVLAASRQRPRSHLMALAALQNGLALASCLDPTVQTTSLAGLVLAPLFAVGLLLDDRRRTKPRAERPRTAWLRRSVGWMPLLAAVAILAASVTAPLDPLAAVFVPLLAVWGIADAWAMRHRTAGAVTYALASVVRLALLPLTAGTGQPLVAWLALVGAIAATLLPSARHRRNDALLAAAAAGLALFGLLTMTAGPPLIAFAALLAGLAVIAATLPDLGVVAVLLLLRLTRTTGVPATAATMLTVTAALALACCALLLTRSFTGPAAPPPPQGPHRRARLTLLSQAQTALAAVAVGLDVPPARFAAVVLLALLILTRTAGRIARGRIAAAATAGLGGIPPFGVFPGLLLVLLAIGGAAPWLLPPVALALLAVAAAAMPRGSDAPHWDRTAAASLLPLALAFLLGFFAPDSLVAWLRDASAARP